MQLSEVGIKKGCSICLVGVQRRKQLVFPGASGSEVFRKGFHKGDA